MARRHRNRTSPSFQPDVRIVRVAVRSPLQLLEDRRLFHPARDLRPVRSFFMRPRLIVASVKKPRVVSRKSVLVDSLSHRIGFDVPRNVAICVRRKTRKEVIIAKRVALGGGGAKHRNIWSDVKC